MIVKTEKFIDIETVFEMCSGWEDRYQYLIDIGREMPSLEDDKKIDAYRVDGCVSNVWLVPKIETCNGNKCFFFQADSDSFLVRGIISILSALINGQPVNEIVNEDIRSFISHLKLDEHLTTQRSNGLMSMISKIHEWVRIAYEKG